MKVTREWREGEKKRAEDRARRNGKGQIRRLGKKMKRSRLTGRA